MYANFEITTCYILKNLLVSAALLWLSCESRHLLGVGRNGSISVTEATGLWTIGGIARGHSHVEFENFSSEKFFVPTAVWMFMSFVIFFFAILCVCFCVSCKTHRGRLMNNINSNPPVPRFETPLTMSRENILTPVDVDDIPPDYTVVVNQKTMGYKDGDSLCCYPKVVRGKKLETPPPAYITVAPFK